MQNFETVGTKSFLHILLGFGIQASSQVLCKQDTADDLHTHTHTQMPKHQVHFVNKEESQCETDCQSRFDA